MVAARPQVLAARPWHSSTLVGSCPHATAGKQRVEGKAAVAQP